MNPRKRPGRPPAQGTARGRTTTTPQATPIPCPDCGAQGPDIAHQQTCPQGRALDASTLSDEAWFDTHPGATWRQRPMWPCERTQLRLLGIPQAITASRGRVLVKRLMPRVQTRTYQLPGGYRVELGARAPADTAPATTTRHLP